MAKQIRILLADDHTVLRQGLAQMLESQPDMTVVAQANTGKEAVEFAKTYQPKVILMDIQMPDMDGIEATRQIMIASPLTGIIILTMYRQDKYILEAIRSGAKGYLLKEVELDELLNGIRMVASGQAIVDPVLTNSLFSTLRKPNQAQKLVSQLDERDREILRLLAEGLTNQAIADQLQIAEKTVRNRLTQIFRKLNLANRSQAIVFALQNGLGEGNEGS